MTVFAGRPNFSVTARSTDGKVGQHVLHLPRRVQAGQSPAGNVARLAVVLRLAFGLSNPNNEEKHLEPTGNTPSWPGNREER